MFKIKNKTQYYVYLIYTLLAAVLMLISYIVLVTSLGQAVPGSIRIAFITTSIATTLFTYYLFESVVNYLVEQEKEQNK